jgi:hypothetical protein
LVVDMNTSSLLSSLGIISSMSLGLY